MLDRTLKYIYKLPHPSKALSRRFCLSSNAVRSVFLLSSFVPVKAMRASPPKEVVSIKKRLAERVAPAPLSRAKEIPATPKENPTRAKENAATAKENQKVSPHP